MKMKSRVIQSYAYLSASKKILDVKENGSIEAMRVNQSYSIFETFIEIYLY